MNAYNHRGSKHIMCGITIVGSLCWLALKGPYVNVEVYHANAKDLF